MSKKMPIEQYLKRMVVAVVGTVGLSFLFGGTAWADDPGAITGWQNFQFGMMYPDAQKLCTAAAKINLQAGVGQTPGYAEVGNCKKTDILGTKFTVQLTFTLSGDLYKIDLCSGLIKNASYDEIINALVFKYGPNFDYGQYISHYSDGGTFTDYVKYWPSNFSRSTDVSSYEISRLGGIAFPNSVPPYRIEETEERDNGGLNDEENSLCIEYDADLASYTSWVGKPQLFQPAGQGQL